MSITLKPLTVQYLSDYMQVLNDPAVRQMTQPYEEFSILPEENLREWLIKIPHLPDRKDFAIVRESDGLLVGEIVINEVKDGSANIRLAIGSAHWGQGYGTLAMAEALRYAFESMHLEQIKLSVFNMNERGLNLYRKMGFKVESLGEFQGYPETLMSIYRADWVNLSFC